MTYENLEVLGQLLGCYFHQDWPDEFDSDDSVFQMIVNCETEEQLTAGVKEIDALLASSLSELELGELLLSRAGCYFDPGSIGLTLREWLKLAREKFFKG